MASKYSHLLLSLPSPNQNLVEEFDSLIYDFIWNSKPAKFRKPIVESNITNDWLGLHRLCFELKTIIYCRYIQYRVLHHRLYT